jgi:hypothetical protein
LVLLNQDTRVYPDWLLMLTKALDDPKVGVVGCKSLYPDGQTIQHAGGRVEWPLGTADHYGAGERDAGQWDEARKVQYVTGAAMAFRQDLLERVGLLDEGFWPGYFEDTDFCFRAHEAGYEVWYVPDAVLIHEELSSLAGVAALSTYFHQGRLRFVLKHLEPARFLKEFVPAEKAVHLDGAQGELAVALRLAYMKAISLVATLYPRRWRADASEISAVLDALQRLYLFPIAREDPLLAQVEPLELALPEFDFRSEVPVFGPLIARIRLLWYSVAAQWAVRHLARQQATINRRLWEISERQESVKQLYVGSLVSLCEDVARLTLRLEAEHVEGSQPSTGNEAT